MKFYGLLNFSWTQCLVLVLVMTHITIVGVTVFLHRCQAHRALEMHPILSHFFRFWLWMTTGMNTKAWAAIHRKHHAKCETPDDPHSPQVMGLKQVLWRGAELYRAESRNTETLTRYGHGTPNDWIENNLYTPYSSLGFTILLVLELILFGVPGLTIWAIQMAWIPFFAAGIINGIGHFWGYRNFECPDAATNISPWGILIGGEELHNNHHTYPTSAKLSVKWWEFDIGWLYIKIFSALGLAKVKRVVPTPTIIPGKSQVDIDTLKALISNRIHVMTLYSKTVILPVFLQEKQKQTATGQADPSVWQKMRNVLMKEPSLIEPQKQHSLEAFIEKYDNLHLVYKFQKNLQEIWNKTSATQKELLEALQEWCAQAESAGVVKLREFVPYIKGYALRMA
jgi:stearoyl-CoA desaturase (delta-9 desaturase)